MKKLNLCKIQINDFLDSKEFPKIMKKNKVKILSKEDGRNKVTFTVEGSEDSLEEIMIYTSLRWSFA